MRLGEFGSAIEISTIPKPRNNALERPQSRDYRHQLLFSECGALLLVHVSERLGIILLDLNRHARIDIAKCRKNLRQPIKDGLWVFAQAVIGHMCARRLSGLLQVDDSLAAQFPQLPAQIQPSHGLSIGLAEPFNLQPLWCVPERPDGAARDGVSGKADHIHVAERGAEFVNANEVRRRFLKKICASGWRSSAALVHIYLRLS